MKEHTKELARKIISEDGGFWKTLKYIHHTPTAYARRIYRRVTRNSIFFKEEELGMCSLQHPKKLAKTLHLFEPRSVLDIGCGTGVSLDYFLQNGVDALGIEGSSLARDRAQHPERIELHNLNEELHLNRRFDLIWCLEVAEHIHPKFVNNFIKTFANHSNRVVLSAAQPGQGGEGHFNEQPAEYWIELFGTYGFTYDDTSTKELQSIDEMFCENMLVFYRQELNA